MPHLRRRRQEFKEWKENWPSQLSQDRNLLTIHLALIWKYDLSPPARRVDGQRFLKALLDVWTPDAFRVTIQSTVSPICQSLSVPALLLRPIRAASATPLRRNDDGSSYTLTCSTWNVLMIIEFSTGGKKGLKICFIALRSIRFIMMDASRLWLVFIQNLIIS